MTKENRTGRYPYEVEPFQEDCSGRLSWGVLGNHLLKCAGMHANHHGFGLLRLHEESYAWVLSRLVIEMSEMPKTGEAYTIETWICNLYRLFTDRCFSITGQDGKVFGHAYSVWAMISLTTRKPAELEAIATETFADIMLKDRIPPVRPPGRIRVKADTPVRTLDTYYSDIDINGHVNSIRYIEMIVDLFPKELYACASLKRLEVAYSAESYWGDRLSFYQQQTAANTYAVEVRKNNATVVCRAEVTFGESSPDGTETDSNTETDELIN